MDWQWFLNDGRYGGEGVKVSSEGVVSDVMASVPNAAAADSGRGVRVGGNSPTSRFLPGSGSDSKGLASSIPS